MCRDFANGFLFAEILARYYPADVQMHSFENVASMQRKKQNWSLLEKFFKVSCMGAWHVGIMCKRTRLMRQFCLDEHSDS